MFCDVEMQDPATIMAQDYQYEQDPEGSRGNGEEIEGDQLLGMVLKKRLPSLARWYSMPVHVF